MIRIEEFDANGDLLVKGDHELIGIAVANSNRAYDMNEMSIWANNQRLFKGLMAFFFHTKHHPEPFEVRARLKDGTKLHVEGATNQDKVVAVMREGVKQYGPQTYAEQFIFQAVGSGVSEGVITVEEDKYLLYALYGFEYDPGYNALKSAFETEVYVDGIRVAKGPMHTITSWPGHVVPYNRKVHKTVSVRVSTGSSLNKPVICAVFVERTVELPRAEEEPYAPSGGDRKKTIAI